MDVMTVTGPVRARDLGITLIHEHILFNGDWHHKPIQEDLSRRAIGESQLRMETLGWARKFGYEHLDNSHRIDPEEAMRELSFFKGAGGQTVIDQTPIGLGRDPAALRAIARGTGLNVVMGCGYYVDERHPPELKERSVEDIADELVRDVTVGVGTTGVRAGIIGEIGTGDPVTPTEEKVLRAAARAQATTGVALSIHHVMWGRTAPRLIEICQEEGADPRRIIICHLDLDARCPLGYHREIADMGAYLAFDTFGHYDFYTYGKRAGPNRVYSTDWDRAEKIAALVGDGYLAHVVVAQDVCFKTQLKKYGGFGFDHILESALPHFRSLGMNEEQIQAILVDNPRRVIAGE
ncbi:MAG TPA: phosphotriesterase-related protein [Chloroflexota bacterium]|jgi:phosphotriesterase-related protein|nr:phosphotriesterase-related protein [Chloroflexota bacterium]